MVETIRIAGDLEVRRIGLGTNRVENNEQSRRALRKAREAGINFIDTAAAYTGGKSETAIGETLAPYDGLVIATKGGMHPPNFSVDCRPEALAQQLETSLSQLKLNTIDLYFLHRVDSKVPLSKQLSFLKQMQQEGNIKHIGLSEVSVAQIQEAQKHFQVAAVENHYNLSERKYDDVVDFCEKEGIVFVPFYPLHGYIADELILKELKQKYNATEAQIALAWLLARSKIILPIPGSLSEKHIEENFTALKIELAAEDFKRLSAL